MIGLHHDIQGRFKCMQVWKCLWLSLVLVMDKSVHNLVILDGCCSYGAKRKLSYTSKDCLWEWNYTMSRTKRSFLFLDKENQVTCSPINYFSSFQGLKQLLQPPAQLVLPDFRGNWDGLQQMTWMQESKPGLLTKNRGSFGNISGTVRNSRFLSASVKSKLFIHANLGDFHLFYLSLSTKRKLKSHGNNKRQCQLDAWRRACLSQQPTHTKEILGPLGNAKQQSGYREQQLHRRRNSAQLSISSRDFFSSSFKANQLHVPIN